VEKRGRREGWLMSKDDAERVIDSHNRRGESFNVRGKSAPDPNKPTAKQIANATRFGLTQERFAQLFGKISKSSMNSVDSDD
jgi:hypothetical protein